MYWQIESFNVATIGGKMNCDSCEHLGDYETLEGEAYRNCSIVRCPLIIEKNAFNEGIEAAAKWIIEEQHLTDSETADFIAREIRLLRRE